MLSLEKFKHLNTNIELQVVFAVKQKKEEVFDK